VLYLRTVCGPVEVGRLALILPHEHVFTDLRPPDTPGFGQACIGDVVAVMRPHLEAARAAGVSAIIECTPLGVGRNVRALRALAEATSFPIVASAGAYREPFMPQWVREASEQALMRWLRQELCVGIDDTDIVGGLIKLACNDPMTVAEAKLLRAAGRVGAELGVAIACHTPSGRLALEELGIVTGEGFPAERFVWVHAQNEPDMGLHRELASRGCYVEFDGIAEEADLNAYIEWISALFRADLQDRVLISQDAGWYCPGEPGGGQIRPYDFLPRRFLPLLRANGFSEGDIRLLTVENVARAFGCEQRGGEGWR
jgi:phosphotriesterase-related protein